VDFNAFYYDSQVMCFGDRRI